MSTWQDTAVGDFVHYFFKEVRGGEGIAKSRVFAIDETSITLEDGATFDRITGEAIGSEEIVHAGLYGMGKKSKPVPSVSVWAPERLIRM